MVEWNFAFKVFFMSVLGTFFAMGILTLIIKLLGIIFTYFRDDANDAQD